MRRGARDIFERPLDSGMICERLRVALERRGVSAAPPAGMRACANSPCESSKTGGRCGAKSILCVAIWSGHIAP